MSNIREVMSEALETIPLKAAAIEAISCVKAAQQSGTEIENFLAENFSESSSYCRGFILFKNQQTENDYHEFLNSRGFEGAPILFLAASVCLLRYNLQDPLAGGVLLRVGFLSFIITILCLATFAIAEIVKGKCMQRSSDPKSQQIYKLAHRISRNKPFGFGIKEILIISSSLHPGLHLLARVVSGKCPEDVSFCK